MYTGTLHAASNRADWGFSLTLTDPDAGTAIDLTGATIKIAISGPETSAPLITGVNGDALAHVTITSALGGVLAVFVGKAELGALSSGFYRFGMTITLSSGVTYQQMAMELPVVDGVVAA